MIGRPPALEVTTTKVVTLVEEGREDWISLVKEEEEEATRVESPPAVEADRRASERTSLGYRVQKPKQ